MTVTLQDDETMGLNFKKELVVDEVVVFPAGVRDAPPPTRLQERLLNKLGKARLYVLSQTNDEISIDCSILLKRIMYKIQLPAGR